MLCVESCWLWFPLETSSRIVLMSNVLPRWSSENSKLNNTAERGRKLLTGTAEHCSIPHQTCIKVETIMKLFFFLVLTEFVKERRKSWESRNRNLKRNMKNLKKRNWEMAHMQQGKNLNQVINQDHKLKQHVEEWLINAYSLQRWDGH